MPLPIIHALGLIKKAAAEVNRELGAARPASAPSAIVRGGRRGDRRRQARRAVPAGGLADRLRHPDQHERQRGDRQPRQRAARRQARRQDAGASQRSRQHEPVVERRLPDRDAHRGGDARSPQPARSGARAPAARRWRPRPRQFAAHRQDRPHPHAGRDAADARPGILRLCARRSSSRIARMRAGARASSIRWRRAAPRSAPGSTPSRTSPTASRSAHRAR